MDALDQLAFEWNSGVRSDFEIKRPASGVPDSVCETKAAHGSVFDVLFGVTPLGPRRVCAGRFSIRGTIRQRQKERGQMCGQDLQVRKNRLIPTKGRRLFLELGPHPEGRIGYSLGTHLDTPHARLRILEEMLHRVQTGTWGERRRRSLGTADPNVEYVPDLGMIDPDPQSGPSAEDVESVVPRSRTRTLYEGAVPES